MTQLITRPVDTPQDKQIVALYQLLRDATFGNPSEPPPLSPPLPPPEEQASAAGASRNGSDR